MKIKRLAALMLSLVLAACLLSGCGGGSSSSSSDESSSEAAASSEASPSSKAEASASGLLPSDDENSIAITDPSDALQSSLGWGPGTAGTSLKSVVAAADMLAWAENNNVSHQSRAAVKTVLTDWYANLSDTKQSNLADAWPLIKADADALFDDKASMSGRISDAGLEASKLPGCTLKNWETVRDILDDIIPEGEQQ